MSGSRYPSFQRRDGFALVVVVLVTGVSLLAFMFSAVTLTVASRTSVARERASSQALLAADSGLRTLLARSKNDPYISGTFASWIADSPLLRTLDLGDGISAEVVVLDEDLTVEEPWVLVESTGTVGSGFGSARRTLVQRFLVEPGDPVPLSVSVPAALTSVGSIISTNNAASVVGVSNDEAAWMRTGVPLCDASVGEYVELSGDTNRYRVMDAGDTELACLARTYVLEAANGSIQSPSGNTTVTHIPFATMGPLSFVDASQTSSLVPVTDATRALFAVGSSVTIGTTAGDDDSVGEVKEVVIDADTGAASLRIDWAVPPAMSNAPAGTVVRRNVTSGLTQGTCPYDNKDVLAPAFQSNGCTDEADLTSLFVKTFGVTEEQMLGLDEMRFLAPDALKQGSPASGRTLSGWNWYTPEQGSSNVQGQIGSGVLIIDARNLSNGIQLNVNNDFTGLIYVLGDADLAGNAEYVGAIIIDGAVSIKNNDGTSVGGTVDVNYDPLATSRALAGLTTPSEDPGRIGQPVVGTWRVR